MTNEPADALVVGGGPAGSAVAQRLARAGRRVVLIDRARFPREKPCSEYLSPETVRHLALLGVLEALDAHPTAAPLHGSDVTAAHGASLSGRFAAAGGTPFRATGLALPRRVLDATLLDAARAAGAMVHEATTLRRLVRHDDGTMHAQLLDEHGAPREWRARVVIGADGLHSRVARDAGLRRQGALRRVAFVAHVDQVEGLHGRADLHVTRDAYVGLNAMGGGVANVALVVAADRARAAKGRATEFFFDQLAQFPAVRDRIDRRRLVRDVLAVGPFDATCRRSVAAGTLLVGDAADFFDPFTGEGIHAALAGAVMAADVLDEALAHDGPLTADRLAPYRALRRRRFLGKWLVERMIGYAMLAPRLFDRAVERLQRRGMADTLIGVTGDFLPASRVLNPAFLTRMMV